MPLPKKILIANRGEIACRIMRTCREMGIATLALYSEADAKALHTQMADEAACIGPAPVAKSYLNVEAILQVAADTGADAVHPGYGFLSENADFARAVQRAGMLWIGPDPDMIEAMGDKERARTIALDAGVPVLPGSPRFSAEAAGDLHGIAETLGYPLLVKAAAGGGGIGMRIVEGPDQLNAQIETAQKLAARTFGDDSVYLERYVRNARHVEVQVFGYGNGEGVHVFDRDCTIQRRFQKVVEEAPAPALPDDLVRQLRDSALALVRRQNYVGAGTLEFIFDCDLQEFYFLEMNTRIQVEHTVSEMISGLDLVRWQIEIAGGVFDAPPQSAIRHNGHAVECRIYAENPDKTFFPSPGTLTRLRFPDQTADLRIDTGVREGDDITPFYDPMIAKMITFGETRQAAIDRMTRALADTRIEGLASNLGFLAEAMTDPAFVNAGMTTAFVETWQEKRARMVASV
ncbi:MAG: biotin carboxylase N-terminal domain-containing protein [Pseudomonadota bacterium]